MPLQIVFALAMVAATDRPTLRGVVRGSDGTPLGEARVMIHTAQPRVGTSSFCPSCYLDCGRSATTGPDGRFEIPHLDPALLFRVVAMAKKHQAVFLSKVDPAAAEVSLSLQPSPPLPSNPKRVLRGQVVGPTGPVAAAIVEPQGYTLGDASNGSTTFGGTERIMPPTVTDSSGEFEMALGAEVDSLVLLVSPRGLTRRAYARVPTGLAQTKLPVSYGAAVRGRIVKDRHPLTGIAVNLEQQDRDAEQWVGTYSARTDESGTFLITNALPDVEMIVVGASQDVAAFGYTPARPLKTGGEETILDLGDLDVRPGHRVAGRVVLSDGKQTPEHTRLLLLRESVGDAQDVELSRDGAFELPSVPEEVVSLSVRVPGYSLSKQNASLVPGNGDSLLGVVPSDLKLTVLLEPEPSRRADSHTNRAALAERRKTMVALREKPLEGVEPEQPKLEPSLKD
jgi:hypothetical protein